jgi:hypothetical protein
VHYDYEGPYVEVADRVAGWDPGLPLPAAGTNGIAPGQLGAFDFAGRDGFPLETIRPDKNNLAPRLGFAFKPNNNNRTVIRGGFAVMYGGNYDGNVLQTGSQASAVSGTLALGRPPC